MYQCVTRVLDKHRVGSFTFFLKNSFSYSMYVPRQTRVVDIYRVTVFSNKELVMISIASDKELKRNGLHYILR